MPTRRRLRRTVVGRATGRFLLFRLFLISNADQLSFQRGREGEESQDYGYNFANARRRSNSSTQALGDFKTKFETVEADPVFEEELHGARPEDGEALDKEESTDSSTIAGSIEEEAEAKKL